MKLPLSLLFVLAFGLSFGFIKDPSGKRPSVPESSEALLQAQQSLGGVAPAVQMSKPREEYPAPTLPVNDPKAASAVASVAGTVASGSQPATSLAPENTSSPTISYAAIIGAIIFGVFWLAGKKQNSASEQQA